MTVWNASCCQGIVSSLQSAASRVSRPAAKLPSSRHTDHREGLADLDLGAGLFERFTPCRIGSRLTVLHEAGGKGPQAVAGGDRPPAEQDLVTPLGNAADDEFGVQVMNHAATLAHVAGQVVTVGNQEAQRFATFAAELHSRDSLLPGLIIRLVYI